MKKLVVTLFCTALLVFASTANAAFVEIEKDLKFVQNGDLAAYVATISFTSEDLLNANGLSVHVPLNMTANLTLSNLGWISNPQLFVDGYPVKTSYLADVSWALTVSVNGVEDPLHSIRNTQTEVIDFTFDEDIVLPYLKDDVTALVTSSNAEIYLGNGSNTFEVPLDLLTQLLEENDGLVTFTITLSEISITEKDSTVGLSVSHNISFDGKIVIDEITNTPEPATMAIFGLAALGGLPLARRFRRK